VRQGQGIRRCEKAGVPGVTSRGAGVGAPQQPARQCPAESQKVRTCARCARGEPNNRDVVRESQRETVPRLQHPAAREAQVRTASADGNSLRGAATLQRRKNETSIPLFFVPRPSTALVPLAYLQNNPKRGSIDIFERLDVFANAAIDPRFWKHSYRVPNEKCMAVSR
jgi:hypothetical protein